MTGKEFQNDIKRCESKKLAHIYETGENPVLVAIDRTFGAADYLSIENAERHRRILLVLSIVGTILTISFLLYDEIDMYNLIFACGVMLLSLFGIRRLAGKLDCHRKYIDYRVLAESLRLQFYLRYAGSTALVANMMPWSIRMGSPWVVDELENTMMSETANKGQEIPGAEGKTGSTEKHLVLDCWILDQLAYHKNALKKNIHKDKANRYIVRTVLIITILVYVLAAAFEIRMIINPIETPIGNSVYTSDIYRTAIKVLLGSLSAVTLFTGNYYGKMSLENVINDHKRMIALYKKTEQDILENGESEELLLDLAREYLNENSTWYAYQGTNGPDISI